jgi:hypothetical protein
MINRIFKWWKQLRCDHFWRPARAEYTKRPGYVEYSQLVKFCDYCEKEVPISIGEFYAQFGRMPF